MFLILFMVLCLCSSFKIIMYRDCSNTRPHRSYPVSYKSYSIPKPAIPHDLRGTPTHRRQLHSADQEMSDQPPSLAPKSLGPSYPGKTTGPSPTSLSCTSQLAGNPPAGRLLQQTPINQTLQPVSPTLPSHSPIPGDFSSCRRHRQQLQQMVQKEDP